MEIPQKLDKYSSVDSASGKRPTTPRLCVSMGLYKIETFPHVSCRLQSLPNMWHLPLQEARRWSEFGRKSDMTRIKELWSLKKSFHPLHCLPWDRRVTRHRANEGLVLDECVTVQATHCQLWTPWVREKSWEENKESSSGPATLVPKKKGSREGNNHTLL